MTFEKGDEEHLVKLLLVCLAPLFFDFYSKSFSSADEKILSVFECREMFNKVLEKPKASVDLSLHLSHFIAFPMSKTTSLVDAIMAECHEMKKQWPLGYSNLLFALTSALVDEPFFLEGAFNAAVGLYNIGPELRALNNDPNPVIDFEECRRIAANE